MKLKRTLIQKGFVFISKVLFVSIIICLSSIKAYAKTTNTVSVFIESDRINTITADDNYLWFGTLCGVKRFDLLTQKMECYTTEKDYIHAEVRRIAVGKNEVWFNPLRIGISKYDKFTSSWTYYGHFFSREKRKMLNPIIEGATTSSPDNKFLWFGTQENKDIYHPEIYHPALIIDAKHIWVQRRYDLYQVDKKKNIWEEIEPHKIQNPSDGRWSTCTAFSNLTSNKDSLWMTTAYRWFYKNRLLEYNKKNGSWKEYPKNLPGDYTTALASDDDYVWIGTCNIWMRDILNLVIGKGIIRYDKKKGEWKTYTGPEGLKGNKVYFISIDGDYTWFLTNKGIYCYNKKVDKWFSLHSVIRRQIEIRNIDTLQKQSLEEFLNSLDKTMMVNRQERRFSRFLDRYFEVRNNILWIGDRHKAVYSLDLETLECKIYVFKFQKSLPNNFIVTMAKDEDNIWVGTRSTVSAYDRKNKEWITYPDIGWPNRIIPHNGKVYVITVTDISMKKYQYQIAIKVFNKKTKEWTTIIMDQKLSVPSPTHPSTSSVTCVAFDGNNIWIGTEYNGLLQYDISSNQWRRYPFNNWWVKGIVVEGDTIKVEITRPFKHEEKFYILSKKENWEPKFLPEYTSIFADWITARDFSYCELYSDLIVKENDYALCLNGGNIYKRKDMERKGAFMQVWKEHYRFTKPHADITTILIDGEYVWLGTRGRGVFRFNRY